MPRLVQSDLEAAVGGASVLRDLLDKNDDGVPDAELVEEVIDTVEGEVKSAVEVAIRLDDPAVEQSRILHQKKRVLAKFWCYHVGTNGQAVPQEARDAYQEVLDWLDRVALGRRTLGHSPAPATSYPVETVDIDPEGTRVTRDNLKHFC